MIKLPDKDSNSILFIKALPEANMSTVLLGILHLICHRYEDSLLENFFAEIVLKTKHRALGGEEIVNFLQKVLFIFT